MGPCLIGNFDSSNMMDRMVLLLFPNKFLLSLESWDLVMFFLLDTLQIFQKLEANYALNFKIKQLISFNNETYN